MDFTREPVIETVITPKEGCKLVVRSSKSPTQEEYFVDAVEMISFGHSHFFRSLERPKAFLVPASDYEILEVREARMVLKNVGLDRSIKIGGGRDASFKPHKEMDKPEVMEPEVIEKSSEEAAALAIEMQARLDKKRDRRGRYRRKRNREEGSGKEEESSLAEGEGEKEKNSLTEHSLSSEEDILDILPSAPSLLSSILPPPINLISETMARYKDNAMFKGAFFLREEGNKEVKEKEQTIEPVKEVPLEDKLDKDSIIETTKEESNEIETPTSFSKKEEEDIYRHQASSFLPNENLMNSHVEPSLEMLDSLIELKKIGEPPIETNEELK